MKSLNILKSWNYSNLLRNKRYTFNRNYVLRHVSNVLLSKAYHSISKWKNYKATPLISLDTLNQNLNFNKIFYKDESKRFHLKSFKALGGAFAVEKISKGKKNIVISSATAGNHGRSVAWGAKRLNLKCKIFVSQYVSETRVHEIEKFGAEVIRVKGNYENSLKECKRQSKKNNWKIVQDVSTKDYKYIPQLTMAGYSIMIKEISKQTNHYITHIFVQAGVGGLAAGVVAGVAKYFKRIPKIIVVEPDRADCVLQSVKANKLKKIKIKKESIMGGMSCNEMSLIPWQILKKTSNYCVSISDKNVSKTVAMLKDKKLSKTSIIGGECATPGIIALVALSNNIKIRKLLDLDKNSNILLIGCEGNADVKLYKQLLSRGRK
ncbi:diaminopropionate ammonia-lyase [Candidatus Pelagibacter sp.]|nr:diaminopropionate ammonia-lyase [Candidatus Pelagibacter sp.]